MTEQSEYDVFLLYFSWLAFPSISAYALGTLGIVTQDYDWSIANFWVDAWVKVNCVWMVSSLIVFVWRNR
jgi:hypothetical protein